MMTSSESLSQKTDWVVVADESRAIFYAWTKSTAHCGSSPSWKMRLPGKRHPARYLIAAAVASTAMARVVTP